MFFPKVGTRRAVVPILVPFLAVLFLTGCKYDAPGNEGTQPTAIPARAITYTSKSAPATTELPCGVRYKINVQVSEVVESCTGYNYTALHNRALALANARMAQLSCPTSLCSTKVAYFSHWRWNCASSAATMRVKANVKCQGASDAAPQSVTDGSAFDYSKPGNQKVTGESSGFDPGEEGEMIEDAGGSDPTQALNCPATVLLVLTYKEKDPVGRPPEQHTQTYEGYVNRADAKARMVHSLYTCASGCDKQAYRALYTSWAFNQPTSEVVVTIYFEAECRRKP